MAAWIHRLLVRVLMDLGRGLGGFGSQPTACGMGALTRFLEITVMVEQFPSSGVGTGSLGCVTLQFVV